MLKYLENQEIAKAKNILYTEIVGPRQVGKSNIIRMIAEGNSKLGTNVLVIFPNNHFRSIDSYIGIFEEAALSISQLPHVTVTTYESKKHHIVGNSYKVVLLDECGHEPEYNKFIRDLLIKTNGPLQIISFNSIGS